MFLRVRQLHITKKDNSIGLDQYTNDGAQKWKLNCYGLEGFAANSKMSEGEKGRYNRRTSG